MFFTMVGNYTVTEPPPSILTLIPEAYRGTVPVVTATRWQGSEDGSETYGPEPALLEWFDPAICAPLQPGERRQTWMRWRSKRWGKKLRDQRLSAIPPILGHKAGKAGIPYKEVDPAHTTTDCSQCGHRQPMPLEVRVYECGSCGMVMCRDCNAAINISVRAFGRMAGSGGIPRCRRAVQDVDIRPCSLQGESGILTPQNSIEQQAA